MTPVRSILVVYLCLIAVAVSYPLGPSRPSHKLRWLSDAKPVHTDALARDVAINVGLFLPVGLLAGRAFGVSASALMLIALGGGVASVGIETAQHLFLPWRYSSWVDVLSNTAGAGLGAGAAWLVDPARTWAGRLPTASSDHSAGHQ
jgi:VanZ family protein